MPPALINPADRFMTIRGLISALTQQEDLNFLLTNRIPRAALTRFMGWFGKIEQPLVRDLSIACWRLFSDLDLSEARKTDFKSLHDCFTRLGKVEIGKQPPTGDRERSEEHTSELQSHLNLVCRLLLEKKKIQRDHN